MLIFSSRFFPPKSQGEKLSFRYLFFSSTDSFTCDIRDERTITLSVWRYSVLTVLIYCSGSVLLIMKDQFSEQNILRIILVPLLEKLSSPLFSSSPEKTQYPPFWLQFPGELKSAEKGGEEQKIKPMELGRRSNFYLTPSEVL